MPIPEFFVRQASQNDLTQLGRLFCLLWPHHSEPEAMAELTEALKNMETPYFLVFPQAGSRTGACGFCTVSLRRDYVEGTSTSPVGYLEGIFTEPAYRGMGAARQLLRAAENWAQERGCTEFASDCELKNAQSLAFHLRTGFQEANRIICFIKPL